MQPLHDQSILGAFPEQLVEVRAALMVSSLLPGDHNVPGKDTQPAYLAEDISIWQLYKGWATS